jgi:hypothetical protein
VSRTCEDDKHRPGGLQAQISRHLFDVHPSLDTALTEGGKALYLL